MGIGTHLDFFIRGEHQLHAPTISRVYFALAVLLFIFQIRYSSRTVQEAGKITDLEPTLGMITASLSVMQPALRRMVGLRTEQSSRGRPSSSVTHFQMRRTKKSSFRELEGSYALNDTWTSKTHVGVPSKPALSTGDEEAYFAELGIEPRL